VTRQPDLRELVGEEGPPEELERLRRVHDLLLAAGPPPELPAKLASAPSQPGRVIAFPRRWRLGAACAAAAAVFGLAFGLGYLLGGNNGFPTRHQVAMHAVGPGAASGLIDVGRRDAAGNWELQVVVRGLPRLPGHSWYVLYLTKDGKREVVCGTFKVSGPVTQVRMSAPYDFGEYDGWVVTAHGPGGADHVLLTT